MAAAAAGALLCLVLVVMAAAVSLAAPASPADGGKRRKHGPPLWVFGDSYADTGNLGDLGRELTHAWYDPYGETFPRRPAGRFSDGRVLTDFVASVYKYRNHLVPPVQSTTTNLPHRETQTGEATLATPHLAPEPEPRPSIHPSMAAALLCLALLLLVVMAAAAGCKSERGSGGKRRKHGPPLWVLGDSYADTGNLGDLGRELTHAWYDPYGETFPRRPAGRFSDGRVLTDFVASALGMPTPVAYKVRRRASRQLLARGMNFAVGGAGVLDTGNFQRNISAQIDLFQAIQKQQQRRRGCHSAGNDNTGTALVVVSGNDYAYAADKDNGTSAAIAYIPTVVRELGEQLRRLRDEAGMRRVVVTNLHPMGCTPVFTRPLNYTGCDPLANAGAAQHNAALGFVLAAIDPSNATFLLLDVHTPFAAILLDGSNDTRFASTLRPCCESFSPDGYCGEQDENGTRQYALCDDPRRHFFWDDVHPTQAAWAAVAATFKATVKSFMSS